MPALLHPQLAGAVLLLAAASFVFSVLRAVHASATLLRCTTTRGLAVARKPEVIRARLRLWPQAPPLPRRPSLRLAIPIVAMRWRAKHALPPSRPSSTATCTEFGGHEPHRTCPSQMTPCGSGHSRRRLGIFRIAGGIIAAAGAQVRMRWGRSLGAESSWRLHVSLSAPLISENEHAQNNAPRTPRQEDRRQARPGVLPVSVHADAGLGAARPHSTFPVTQRPSLWLLEASRSSGFSKLGVSWTWPSGDAHRARCVVARRASQEFPPGLHACPVTGMQAVYLFYLLLK